MDSTEVTIYLKNGTSHVMPVSNLPNYVRMQDFNILRIDYGDTVVPEPPVIKAPIVEAPPANSKESLIGHLLDDGKVNAKELQDWIGDSDSAEHITIVLKGEKRKTVIATAKARINELL